MKFEDMKNNAKQQLSEHFILNYKITFFHHHIGAFWQDKQKGT